MGYLQDLMKIRQSQQEANLDDMETVLAILNSQNAVDHEEIKELLRNILFICQIRKHNHFLSFLCFIIYFLLSPFLIF